MNTGGATGDSVQVTMPDPLAPNTPVMYTCMDPTMYFINGPTSSMCDGNGAYANAAPTH